MIRFDHVSKDFGGNKPALSDISVEIPDGDFVFLIGPTGAGKSTLLKLIIRDLVPTTGTITVDNWDITTIPQSQIHLLRRHVRMVFQDFKLLMDRTISENIAVGMEVLGKPKEEIDKGVHDVLELVELSDKADMFPLQLSAGELQRIGIARAIVGGPKILLADEPTGNLDPETSDEILDILKEVNKMGTTVIVVTHNATLVDKNKKRTITLKAGALEHDEIKGKYHLTKRSHHEEKH
jgi:cell division transport system ATP-binding protein